MPLTRFSAEAFGVVTVVLVSLLILLGLFCIYRSLYFQIRILRRDFLQLVYFNGPWVTRIALVLVAIWWGIWEILRLTLLKERLRLFSSASWQKNVCKFYILSNFGFAEPSMFLALIFLLHASLKKRDSGTLSQRWNRKAILYVLLLCLPVLGMQIALVFIGPKLNEKKNGGTKMYKYFINTSSIVKDSHRVCTYPLFSTSLLGLFDLLLILYALYVGRRLLSLVINKRLRRRVYWLISSIFLSLPLRVALLTLSAFLHPGSWAFEAIVFLAFCMLFFSAVVGIFMLVYFPVADSLALRDLGQIEIQEMPYDDYYHDSASLVANQSYLDTGSLADTGRNSDASTKRGSISFRTMIRDEPSTSEGIDEAGYYPSAVLHIASSPSGSPISTRPMLPLREVPRY
ncbi:uncharacterized protein A4U43_C04F27860 [Asparagus officinalis]|uniref:THH1/TOM1/TOM3 domain-containing protein n=1 Tax=Asparagus officinalis TaxID=4686 RepID=A0A5P1F6W9_ASPOF|nr:uncharacterized protein LOC109837978 [Asparagus officinalis]ONK73157.1 uncharacterized protein A4U43_C04F27860 [Asparagus officinalis]